MTTRTATLVLTAAAAVLQALTIGPKAAPRFVWNASESVPTGLYGVQPARRFIVTDLVVAFPPEQLATVLADGGYLPRGLPLIKRVLALPGQIVCRKDLTIIVDGIDGVKHLLDLRPAGQAQQALAAGPYMRNGRAGLAGPDRP